MTPWVHIFSKSSSLNSTQFGSKCRMFNFQCAFLNIASLKLNEFLPYSQCHDLFFTLVLAHSFSWIHLKKFMTNFYNWYFVNHWIFHVYYWFFVLSYLLFGIIFALFFFSNFLAFYFKLVDCNLILRSLYYPKFRLPEDLYDAWLIQSRFISIFLFLTSNCRVF